MDDAELVKALREVVSKQRRHANFFAWHDRSPKGKAVAERGITEDLFSALKKAELGEYGEPTPSGEDWPDCTARRADGTRVAVEVTELVDAQTLSGRAIPAPWSPERLHAAIQERISEKDHRSFHGGKYDEVLLLIHTDEFYLRPTETITLLTAASFVLPYGNVDRAFLLFSYWPELGHCPAVELCLRR